MTTEYPATRINELEDEIRAVLAERPMNESVTVIISTLALLLSNTINPPRAIEAAIGHLREITALYIKARQEMFKPKEKLN